MVARSFGNKIEKVLLILGYSNKFADTRIIEFVSLFTTICSITKCKSCDSNVTFGESNVRGLGFNLVVSYDV